MHLGFSPGELPGPRSTTTPQILSEMADSIILGSPSTPFHPGAMRRNPPSSECDLLPKPSYTNLVVSILILLGVLASYLPQHHRIIRRRTSSGLSPYFVLLGAVSGTCLFANMLVQDDSRLYFGCCSRIGGVRCFSALLGVAQVGTQWACFTAILLLFYLYTPRGPPRHAPLSPEETITTPTHRSAVAITAIYTAHLALTAMITLLLVRLHPAGLPPWRLTLGILAATLTIVQYFPQLYTTFRLREVGSLSIPMMLVQTPGGYLWAASLAARTGGPGWTAWGVYLVAATLQGVLLVMAVWFELGHWRRRRRGKGVEERGGGEGAAVEGLDERLIYMVDEDGERTPLLGDDRRI